MEVRNDLPEDHPYKYSKTKVQWQAEKELLMRALLEEGCGITISARQVVCIIWKKTPIRPLQKR